MPEPVADLFQQMCEGVGDAAAEMLDCSEQCERAAESGEGMGREMEFTRGEARAFHASAEILLDRVRDAMGELERPSTETTPMVWNDE